ncbi:AAA family ATPase, partial [Myxococcota bacterium]|nr:AAA family ATPase [Myxococcota bacterium]
MDKKSNKNNDTPRYLLKECRAALNDHKILVLIGARQVGKSTLVRQLLEDVPDNQKLLLNLDDPFLRDRLLTTEG